MKYIPEHLHAALANIYNILKTLPVRETREFTHKDFSVVIVAEMHEFSEKRDIETKLNDLRNLSIVTEVLYNKEQETIIIETL